MRSPVQVRREVSQDRSTEPLMSVAEPVSEPGYSSPAPVSADNVEQVSTQLPVCSIPGHEDRAAPEGQPLQSTPEMVSAQPIQSSFENNSLLQGSVNQSAEDVSYSQLQSMEGQIYSSEEMLTGGTENRELTLTLVSRSIEQPGRRAGGRRRNRAGNREDGNEEQEAETEIEIPELRLQALSLIRPNSLPPLRMPSTLLLPARPSSELTAIAEEENDKRQAATEARAYADRRFDEVVRKTRISVAQNDSLTVQASSRIESKANQLMDNLRLGAEQADAKIEAAAHSADLNLQVMAEEQKLQLHTEYTAAVRRLRRANKVAHGAAKTGKTRAETHIKNVLTSHAKNFTDEITVTAGEVEAAGVHTLTKIEDFRTRATTPLDLAGQDRESPAQKRIQREVNKAMGAGLADAARSKVNLQLYGNPSSTPTGGGAATSSIAGTGSGGGAASTSNAGLLGQLAAKFTADKQTYHDRLKPSLSENLKSTKKTVNNTLTKTFRKTRSMLRKQYKQAVETIDRELKLARAQLGAQRNLARHTVKTQAESTTERIADGAHSARSSLEKATRAARPHTEKALESLQGSIVGVGLSPPVQLRKTAEIATEQVSKTLDGASGVQRVQTETIESSTLDGTTETASKAHSSEADYLTGELQRVTEAETATTESVSQTVQSTIETFPPAVDSMKTAGQNATGQYDALEKSATETAKADKLANLPDYILNLNNTVTRFTTFSTPFNTAETETETKNVLDSAYIKEHSKVQPALTEVANGFTKIDATLIFDSSEQAALVSSLRGFTLGKGDRFKEKWNEGSYGNLDAKFRKHLDSNNRSAARLYLKGKNAEGAAYELDESRGWINDDESRMEGAMRALNTEQLKELDEAGSNTAMGRMRDDARDVLGGVDRNVFDALRSGNYARADAYRFQETQQENIWNRNASASHTTIRSYVSAPATGQWGQESAVTADQRRQMVANELAHIRNPRSAPPTANLPAEQQQANLQAMAEFATGTHTYTNRYRPQDGERTLTSWRGANHDLMRDLILHGENSREARAATIGVEIERRRGPTNIENLDSALYDPRLNPNNHPPDFVVPEPLRMRAMQERDEMLLEAHSRYGVEGQSTQSEDINVARSELIDRLTRRMGSESVGSQLVAGMVNEPVPSPQTAAYAMQYATQGNGTKEPIIWRFVGRMNSSEIAEMNTQYEANTGEELYDRLGLYGHGRGELSGSDRMRAERMFRGMARTDREKAEAAIYAVLQQRRETGGVGSRLAENTLTDRIMGDSLRELRRSAGGNVTFGPEGGAVWAGDTNFDARGGFEGSVNEQATFASALAGTEQSAKSYQNLIDHYASQASLAITAIGIIAAVAVTIATGGAAGPLLMAAIAGSAGLAGMGAKAAIRGGGYGWEEAAVDLGMTAVDMLTAGVGQALGLASRGGVQAARQGLKNGLSVTAAKQLNRELAGGLATQIGRRGALTGQVLTENVKRGALLTGGGLKDKLAIGAIGGGIGGFGHSLLDERTYDPYSKAGVIGNLLLGTLQGSSVGMVTAGVSHGVENVRIPHLSSSLEDMSKNSALGSVLVEALSSGAGSFAGTGTQLTADRLRGRYKGDFGDALTTMSSEALQNAAQGFFEGAGNAMNRNAPRTRQSGPGPSGDTQGTAAGIAKSVMRGDFLNSPRATSETLNRANRIASDPPDAVGPVRQLDSDIAGEARFGIGGGDTGEPPTTIRVKQIDSPDSRPDKQVPVAQFKRVRNEQGDYEYIVEVSGRAHEAVIERAIAHEFSEIRAIEHRRALGSSIDGPDRLADGAQLPKDGVAPRDALSPHDMGRLAEMEVLARQLARGDIDENANALHRDEAQRLASHLGLVGGKPEAAARRQLAVNTLGDGSDLAGFIKTISAEAQSNPFLKRLDGSVEQNMGTLAERYALAEKIDRDLGARQSEDLNASRAGQNFTSRRDIVLRQAGRLALRDGIMSLNRRRKINQISINGLSRDQILKFAPHAKTLLDHVSTRLQNADYQAEMRGAAADRFRATFDEGMSPRQMADAALTPDRILAAHALDHAKLGDLVGTDPVTVGRLLDARDGLLARRQQMIVQQQNAGGTQATNLGKEINLLNARLNKIAEVLGEVAGRRVVEGRNEDLEEVRFPGRGSGLPDLVYRNKSGTDPTLLIVEAKGGNSELGTRTIVGGEQRVEQGTFEYLKSLATDMTRGSKPPEVQELGREIFNLLRDSPDQIEYQLVQQRLPESGNSLPPPEVGTFNLAPKTQARARGTDNQTAAAVPGSRQFNGDSLSQANQVGEMHQAAWGAAWRLTGRRDGVGSHIRETSRAGRGELARFVLYGNGQSQDIPVIVRPRPAQDMHLSAEGNRSVAQYELQPDGSYVVYLSDKAPLGVYERALAHEIAEISRLPESGVARDDLLVRGETQDHAIRSDDTPNLSPHDEGRIAEIEIIARDIKETQGGTAAESREELGHLARHLGLDQDGPAAAARRQIIFDRLSEAGIDMRTMLDSAALLNSANLLHQIAATTADRPDHLTQTQRAVDTIHGNLSDLPDMGNPDILRHVGVAGEPSTQLHELQGALLSMTRELPPLGELLHMADELGLPHQAAIDLRDRHLQMRGQPLPSAAANSTDALLWRAWRNAQSEFSGSARQASEHAFNTYRNEYSTAPPDRRHEFSSAQKEAEFNQTVRALIEEGGEPVFLADPGGALSGLRMVFKTEPNSNVNYGAQLYRRGRTPDHPGSIENLPLKPGMDDFMDLAVFHHFDRADAELDQISHRVYLRATADDAGGLMRDIVHQMIADPEHFPGVVKAKMTANSPVTDAPGSTFVGSRNETIVIYLSDGENSIDSIYSWLADSPARADILLTGPEYQLPFAAPLRPRDGNGPALGSSAISPSRGRSFGETRSTHVDSILRSFYQRDEFPDFATFRDAVRERMRRARIDPDNPDRNL